MTALPHLQHTVDWNTWANQQVLAALQEIDKPPQRVMRIFAHIIGAEQLWHSRIVGSAKPEVWPELTMEQCASALGELAQTWRTWSKALTAEDLVRDVAYVNSKGEPWTSTVGDIIAHVTHHGSYHRGQIATLLAGAGHAPPYTDYIHATRQRLL